MHSCKTLRSDAFFLLLVCLAIAACETPDDGTTSGSSADTNGARAENPAKNPVQNVGEEASAETNPSADSDATAAEQPDVERQVHATLTERTLVDRLASNGFSLGERLGVGADARTTSALSEHPAFDSIVDVIESDLAEFRSEDPKLGVEVAGHPHRLFNQSWLRSEDAHFVLAGVVNRLDRRPLVDGACGETRLVYRLAYETEVSGQPVASRLPLTLAVDWLAEAPEGGDCRHVARRWAAPDALQGAELADWLASDAGPLGDDRLQPGRIHRVLLNMQSIRWPSVVHPSLGGHAEYVLRSFEPGDEGRFRAGALENTPDVARLKSDADLRSELVEWIKSEENIRQIDRGTALVPDRFLAKRVISAAPHGLARKGNRPFFQLVDAADIEGVDYTELEHVRSSTGLIRRLDDHTCSGCHQGRAVAGFHLLGQDEPDTVAANALAVSMSAHALDEVDRRSSLTEAVLDGGGTDYGRPFSERDSASPGEYGTPCGISDEPTFARWDCADGLECTPYDKSSQAPHVGICLPEKPEVGDPCEVGQMHTRADPVDDRIRNMKRRPCPDGAVCNTNRVGFPGGMCTSDCDDSGVNGRCGAIAQFDTFSACLAQQTPFDECLEKFVDPAGLRACDRDDPCRHDYICARNSDGDGVCLPPYFLFQMRVDGHPN